MVTNDVRNRYSLKVTGDTSPRCLLETGSAPHVPAVDGAEHHPALGIDHGDARIGIAATDPLGILAHPVETIDVRKADPIERIAALALQRSVKTLVLGLPIRLDGTEGTSAEKVRRFGKKLAKRLPDLPLVCLLYTSPSPRDS